MMLKIGIEIIDCISISISQNNVFQIVLAYILNINQL